MFPIQYQSMAIYFHIECFKNRLDDNFPLISGADNEKSVYGLGTPARQ